MASRCNGYGGNKGGRWGYGGGFKGRENNGPRAHHRFGGGGGGGGGAGNLNHKSNGVNKSNGYTNSFPKSNGYSNGNGTLHFLNDVLVSM